MVNVVLVEDSPEAMENIKSYLERYSREKGLEYRFIWFENPINFLTKYSRTFDIILMDIQMPAIDGMETARKMREMDASVPLVFITNMAQFAIKGYEVDASDFIVKPVSYFDFSMKFERVLKKIEKDEDMKIAAGFGGATKYINAKDVRYLEVFKHKLLYHTAEGDFEARGSLTGAEKQLAAHNFVRCNNYCLVNLSYVVGVKGYVLTVSSGSEGSVTEIMISQPRKKEFMKRLNEYFREHA